MCAPNAKLICSAFIILILSFIIYLFVPGEIDPVVFPLSPPQPIPKYANVSGKLSEVYKIHLGKYTAPESIVMVNGSLYTGVDQRVILKINESGVHEFATIPTADCMSKAECGRQNGIRLAPDGEHLIVADAYLGLFSVSISNGEVKKLFPLKDDFKVTFLNDFDFLPNGSIILSESSVKYPMHMYFHDLMEGGPNGRLLLVDPETGDWHQVLDGLYFPSGVQLHADGQSVLVAEATTCRVLRVPLDGGAPRVFVDGLPGVPDNIRPSPRGGYWIPVANLRDSLTIRFADWTANYPTFRTALLKLTMIPTFHFITLTISSALFRYDDNGLMVEAILDPENKVPNVLEVIEVDNRLYTASYFLPYIGQIQL